MTDKLISLPKHGLSRPDILAKMDAARTHDVRWRQGQVFSLVFDAGDEVNDLAKAAYITFFSENGLNPTAFPSLRRFETEVVAMVGALLGGAGHSAGNMTTGGTESILMAVLAAREWARAERPKIIHPEMVLPSSAHPAFDKAAHYFGVKAVRVPVDGDFRADVEAMRARSIWTRCWWSAPRPPTPRARSIPFPSWPVWRSNAEFYVMSMPAWVG